MSHILRTTCLAILPAVGISAPPAALADGNLQNVQHIIVVMQENHAFDNYLYPRKPKV
jgi:phospholipase C